MRNDAGPGHRTYVPQLGVADLKALAAHGTDQVVVGPVGHDGHEVQAHGLLRPDVVKEDLVMTVRAHARRDLALILRTARPEAENHHHGVIEAAAPPRRGSPPTGDKRATPPVGHRCRRRVFARLLWQGLVADCG